MVDIWNIRKQDASSVHASIPMFRYDTLISIVFEECFIDLKLNYKPYALCECI